MRTALAILIGIAAAACSAERDVTGTDGTMHGAGILDPASDDFHGKLAARVAYDLSTCARCHDPAKPGAAPACARCHDDGPSGCTSCHAMPPATGAHRAHASSGSPDSCRTCHPTPAHWMDPGHVGARAVIAFAPIAGPTASFDGARCQNVACHGVAAPAWNGGPAEAACGTCHGNPPANHAPGYACATCHPAGAAHVNGVLDVGVGCDGCHGSAGSPAPPRDLGGNVFTTAIGVGAHQAHLNVPSRLRGPIACATCHAVPTAVGDAGHIDSGPPAEVDPAHAWDRSSATCATWCHGAARPTWTKTGQAVCGSCHGIPPATAAHAPDLQLTDCVTCHSSSVDASGYPIVVDGQPSEHINGRVSF
jgi:predicted CxxxxCH...CXXCH cytochrome family protein